MTRTGTWRAAIATPIGRGFHAARGVDLLTFDEMYAFAQITRWAALGCLHENHSALGAQLGRDAAWLNGRVAERVTRMQVAQREQA